MAGRTLEIKFIGDAKPLQKAFADVEASGSALGGALGKLGSAFSGVATVAGGFLLGNAIMKAPSVLGGLRDLSRDLELQLKKQTTVFGEQLPVVQQWAAANAAAMGLSKNQATNLAAGLADLLIPMGMTREAAAQMSTQTLGLAGALAEWSGGQKNAAEVADILTKAYLGETDGLKALGISISAADVQARLAAKGQKELTGAALEQAQALAIQELIFEKSTDAQNAYANGAGSAARKSAEMAAKLQEAKEKLATGLMPVFTAFASLLATVVIGAMNALTPVISTVTGAISGFVGNVVWLVENGGGLMDIVAGDNEPTFWQQLAFYVAQFVTVLRDQVIPAMVEFVGWAAQIALAFGAEVWGFVQETVIPALVAMATALKDIATQGFAQLSPQIQQFAEDVATLDMSGLKTDMREVGEALRPMVELLRPLVDRILDALRDQVKQVAESMRPLIEELKKWEPVLKPLGILIGAALIVPLAAALIAIEAVVRIVTGALMVALTALTLALEAVRKTTELLAPVVSRVATEVAGFFQDLWNKAQGPLGEIAEAIESITDTVREWGPKVGQAFLNVYQTFKANIQQIIELFAPLLAIGTAIVDGIVDGIWAGAEKLKNAAKAMVGWIQDQIPDWIPHSPSKRGVEIGRGFAQGVAVGIAADTPLAAAAVSNFVNTAMAPITSMFASGSPFIDVNSGKAVPDPAPAVQEPLPFGAFYDAVRGGSFAPAGSLTGGAGASRGGTQVIQLVVDGAVLAEVVNRENERGY